MAIGQYIASLENKSFQDEISSSPGTHSITESHGLVRKDAAIICTGLIEDEVYALEMKYSYSGNGASGAILILSNENETIQMSIGSVGEMIPGRTYTLKIIFSPNRNNYNRIVLRSLKRNSSSDYGDNIKTNISEAKIYKLKNLIPSGITSLKRVGIQGYEGLSFSINKEDFQMGRSGYYTAEDLDINFISAFVPDNEPPFDNTNRRFFIMDYEY